MRAIKSIVSILFFAFYSGILSGQTLTIYPQEAYLIPGKTVTYLVSNPLDGLSSVHIIVEEWHIYRDGTQRFIPTKKLKVTPSHFFLHPQSNTKVEISWNGHFSDSPSTEMPYRISFLRAPMNHTKTHHRAGTSSLYVRPRSPQPKLEISHLEVMRGVLSIVIRNTGSTHLSIADPSLTAKFKTAGQKSIDKPSFIGHTTHSQLHAGDQRILFLKIPREWEEHELSSISLEFRNSSLEQNLTVEKDLEE